MQGSLPPEVMEVQEKLRKLAMEAKQLAESIQLRNKENNYKPIANALTEMLGPLNEEVICAI
jgi:hypothetical protein